MARVGSKRATWFASNNSSEDGEQVKVPAEALQHILPVVRIRKPSGLAPEIRAASAGGWAAGRPARELRSSSKGSRVGPASSGGPCPRISSPSCGAAGAATDRSASHGAPRGGPQGRRAAGGVRRLLITTFASATGGSCSSPIGSPVSSFASTPASSEASGCGQEEGRQPRAISWGLRKNTQELDNEFNQLFDKLAALPDLVRPRRGGEILGCWATTEGSLPNLAAGVNDLDGSKLDAADDLPLGGSEKATVEDQEHLAEDAMLAMRLQRRLPTRRATHAGGLAF